MDEVTIAVVSLVIAGIAAIAAIWQAFDARKARNEAREAAERLEKRETDSAFIEWDVDWQPRGVRITNTGLDTAYDIRYKLLVEEGSAGTMLVDLNKSLDPLDSYYIDVYGDSKKHNLMYSKVRLILFWRTEAGNAGQASFTQARNSTHIYF